MFPITPVTDLDMAFPARVTHLMPKYEDIPDAFKYGGGSKWVKLFNDMFFLGLKKIELQPREGVDPEAAWRQIRCIAGSFAPKHEHKEAAVAYLLDQWFSDGTWEPNEREKVGS